MLMNICEKTNILSDDYKLIEKHMENFLCLYKRMTSCGNAKKEHCVVSSKSVYYTRVFSL